MENIILYVSLSLGLVFLITSGILTVNLMNKAERINRLENALNRLKKSFEELDEQAKLIVRTDLELHQTQEELGKRVSGLDALQKASRLISTTLDEKEIFHRIDHSLITDLGYERNIVLIQGIDNKLHSRLNPGFSDEDISFIIADLEKDSHLSQALKEGHAFSSVTSPQQRRETIARLFGTEHFVLAPILSQNGYVGVIFVGNQSNASPITQGDEEIISILANQIGQSLENARLFEQVFHSQQILESKIRDRTQEVASALEEVKKISKTKSEFISAVSHELRTPLTSIKGYASILMAGKLGDVPEQVKERLSKINMHSDNLVKLINNLLDISRIESGRTAMTMGKCRLSNIVDNVADLLMPQMKEKSIHWKADIAENIPELFLDSSQIERVFINLVGNAIKFTPTEGTISVKASLSQKNIVVVEVTDTGIGISKEDIAKLFDEFYRVENPINQDVKGTGLGLSLAKKIVEAHKGKIWITSIINEGTTFHFTLPVEKQEDLS